MSSSSGQPTLEAVVEMSEIPMGEITMIHNNEESEVRSNDQCVPDSEV